MDQVHAVRHKVLVEERSQRAVARELGLARVTVRKYLDQAVPVRTGLAPPRARPVWDKIGERVQALLTESAAAAPVSGPGCYGARGPGTAG